MKLYIIPGYKETIHNYHWLISKAENKYDVEFLNLQLKDNLLSKLSETKIDSNSTVFGFSTGALIAYKLKTPVRKGIYCSMSDILGNHIEHAIEHATKLFGKKTTDELKKLRYGKSKAKKSVIFYGDKEITPRVFKFGKVHLIKNTGHEFTKAYKQAVLKEI
jgi:hypothetical protein